MYDNSLYLKQIGEFLRPHFRTVPDWPLPGIQFRDITTVLQNPLAFRLLIDTFIHRYLNFDEKPDVIAGLDARGFIFGAVVAYQLNISFVPIRKEGKLPAEKIKESYALEYGEATIEIHSDAVKKGSKVVLMDDLIATGGTMLAGKKLLERLGATVLEVAAVVDLPALGGSEKLRQANTQVFTLLHF